MQFRAGTPAMMLSVFLPVSWQMLCTRLVALQVFCLYDLYLWSLCSYDPLALLFALSQCTQWFYAPLSHYKFSLLATCSLPAGVLQWPFNTRIATKKKWSVATDKKETKLQSTINFIQVPNLSRIAEEARCIGITLTTRLEKLHLGMISWWQGT
jgi:hypothetical protein